MRSSLGRFVRLEIKTDVLRTSLIAVLGWGLIPIVFTLTPQSLAQAAMPTELWMPLLAIFCFGSLFLPEQTTGVAAVINSKSIQLWTVYAVRFAWYFGVLAVLNVTLLGLYQIQGTTLAAGVLLGNALVKSLFIGSITLGSYCCSQSLAVAYLIPTVYFALCIGSNQLGALNLLTLMRQRPLSDNWLQLGVAALFMIISFLLARRRLVNS